MGTGRLPECLCDLGVHLTTYLHSVPPVRTTADILPMYRINKWLTANSVMITSASLHKNCLNRSLLCSCSYRTVTAVGLSLYIVTVWLLAAVRAIQNWVLICKILNLWYTIKTVYHCAILCASCTDTCSICTVNLTAKVTSTIQDRWYVGDSVTDKVLHKSHEL